MKNEDISKFWLWFMKNEHHLRCFDSYDVALTKELDRHIFNIDSQLNWELGAGSNEPTLVISPNYNKELMGLSEQVIRNAPKIEDWAFLCYRPRRGVNEEFEVYINDKLILVNMNLWEFVFLQYPDGEVEILLASNSDLPPEFQPDSSETWILGSIILSSILSEEVVTQYINDWDIYKNIPDEYIGRTKKLIELEKYFI